MDDWERTLLKAMHERDMNDPVYKEGFESEWELNPYVFPEELSDARTRIACLDRALTSEEKEKLFFLGRDFDATDWNRWSKGFYRRNLFKKME